jgi:hypothetical protein
MKSKEITIEDIWNDKKKSGLKEFISTNSAMQSKERMLTNKLLSIQYKLEETQNLNNMNIDNKNTEVDNTDKKLHISDVSESKWNMIPDRCEYNGKIYRILNIELQGGYFTLQDLDVERGGIQVLDGIDMDKCIPIYSH